VSALEGYSVLVVFCVLLFCIGLYFQRKEKQDRMMKKVEAVIASANAEPSYIPLSHEERRTGGDRRRPAAGSAVAQRR
jgi:hypothetical protein